MAKTARAMALVGALALALAGCGSQPSSTGTSSPATGSDNVLPPMKQALAARATVGEVCDALREVWGVYSPSDAL